MPHRHVVVCGVLAIALHGTANAQLRPHVIQGRVTTDSGVAIPAADVIVTIAPTAETLTNKTDSSGAFRVVIPNPTGEYILYIGALGRRPFRQRVTIGAADSVAVVNPRLARAIVAIAPVVVRAQHPRPSATLANDGRAGTDATDKTFDGANGSVPPDLQGNLEAMAATVPTLATAAGGVSAFGLGSEANTSTLNGLAFGGADLPRDARTTTRFRTSPWDPTIGGFSGVQASVSLLPGGNVAARRGHLTLDAPPLQFADPAAARLGQRVTNIAFDEGGVGAYALDKLYYNFGVHLARQTASVASLRTLDPAALLRAGVSPDSAARLVQITEGLGIPVSMSGIPRDRTTTTISGMERIDRAPPGGASSTAPTLALTGFGKYSQADAASLSPTITPAYSGKTTSGLAGVQGLYSQFFGKNADYINETTSGLTFATADSRPYLQLPTGSVVVVSDDGLGSLSFGGNSALATHTKNWTWETINQSGFLAGGHQAMPIKIYLQSRVDGFIQSRSANRLGRFSYASLGDLAANRPSSYARTLGIPDRSGTEWIGAGAVGGNWIGDAFTLTGGVRLDANRFLTNPAYNPDVDRLFGVRTDQLPNGVSMSPRLGFVWRYTPTIGYVTFTGSGASVNRGAAQLRGGVGKFRGVLAPISVADALSFTGLPGGVQQLLCVGSAIPSDNWQSFVAGAPVPASCAGGALSFTDTARAVTTFDHTFRPPESWRGNLGWTTSQILGNYVAIDATYSRTRHLASTLDLNFAGTPRFTLADEGNRPVFVSPSSVVAATGTVSPVESRRLAAYGRVASRQSDLEAKAWQLSATVMPNIPLSAGVVILSYAYVDASAQTRGFEASTAGDPRTIEWSPAAFTPRHTVMAQWARVVTRLHTTVSTMFRVTSGLPFTPIVSGDVNGDGNANDRAFVFDPVNTYVGMPAGIGSLLQAGPPTARACLAKQLGRIAARNGCVGAWGSTMNGSLMLSDLPHLDSRTRIYLSLANITSGVDQLLHGNEKLRGWGVTPLPDPVLYAVRGFDANTQRFIYEVNPRFGASGPTATTRRNPFRITLDVEIGLGPTGDEQRVQQNIRVRPSLVGTRASADTIKARYLRTAGTDIYAQMLRMSDSLALSRAQVERFQARQKILRQRADSIYSILGAYLASLPERYDTRDAAKRVSGARDALWVVIRTERPFVLETLTAGQVRLLPVLGLGEMIMNPDSRSMFFAGGW